MQRPFRFRVWSLEDKRFLPSDRNEGLRFASGKRAPNHFSLDVGTAMNQRHNNVWIVQQSTGLIRGGKELFEGDIVKSKWTSWQWDASELGLVTYMPRSACFKLVNQKKGWKVQCGITNATEVVGNIFENPELVNE